MQLKFSDLIWDILVPYLDDIIVKAKTFDEALVNIEKTLLRLKAQNLKLSPSKCKFFQKSVAFLGHVISEKGVSTCPEKVKSVKELPRPRNAKETKSFVSLVSFYRKFVQGFSTIAKPLHSLTETD